MKTELEYTRLVQRLLAPRVTEGKVDKLAQAFSFGGGGGHISSEAWGMLSPIFHFDYMGAAEFEFGAVPEALGYMTQMELAASVITIEPVPVYVLCDSSKAEAIIDRIRTIGSGIERKDGEIGLKEKSYFLEALRPTKEFHRQHLGWLELDNGFFWSIDQEMWKKFAGLFKVEV